MMQYLFFFFWFLTTCINACTEHVDNHEIFERIFVHIKLTDGSLIIALDA